MLKNLASSLLLTEKDAEFDDNAPAIKGRVVTTMAKAKEVRPLIERCVTIARKTLKDQRNADALDSPAERDSEDWKTWRNSQQWNEWNQAVAPVLTARRRAIKLLGNKEAVSILFDTIAPRFEDRPGGYTRIMRLAQPRLGDAGVQVILEFVGERDRVKETAPEPIQVEEADMYEALAAPDSSVDEAAEEEISVAEDGDSQEESAEKEDSDDSTEEPDPQAE